MGVLQVGGDPDLTQKALDAEHCGELGAQHFQGDVATVLQVPCQIYGRHGSTFCRGTSSIHALE